MKFRIRVRIFRYFLWLTVVSAIVLFAYCNWPSAYFAQMYVERIRAKIVSYDNDNAWKIFSLDDSVDFVMFEERDSIVEHLASVDPKKDWKALYETTLRASMMKLALDNSINYMNSARLFYLGIEKLSVDYHEPFQDNDAAITIYGLSSIKPAGTEFDLYIGRSGKPVFPIPLADLYSALADILQTEGQSGLAYSYRFDAALDEAQFGQLTIKRASLLIPIPSEAGDIIPSMFTNISSLLDTIHSDETLRITRKLIEDAEKAGLMSKQQKEFCVAECDAIAAYNARDYQKSISLFNSNLSAGLPGTAFYLSLCAQRLGLEESPGANMLDISENLMKDRAKKKGQENPAP